MAPARRSCVIVLVIAAASWLLPILAGGDASYASSRKACAVRTCKSQIAACRDECVSLSEGREARRCRKRCKSQTAKACRRGELTCSLDVGGPGDPNALGIFGTVNGKQFASPALAEGRGQDTCVSAFVSEGSLQTEVTVSGLECIGDSEQSRRVRPRFKSVHVGCFLPQSLAPPQEGPCIGYYGEHTNDLAPPLLWWATTADKPLMPGQPVPVPGFTSSVDMRIEAFDGRVLQGTISGVFDRPDDASQSPQAAPIETLRFRVPLQGSVVP